MGFNSAFKGLILFASLKLKLFKLMLSVLRFSADDLTRTSSHRQTDRQTDTINISRLANFITNTTQKCLQESNNSVIKSCLVLLTLVCFTFQLNTQHGYILNVSNDGIETQALMNIWIVGSQKLFKISVNTQQSIFYFKSLPSDLVCVWGTFYLRHSFVWCWNLDASDSR
jgi:hypothetical protein